MEVKGGEREGLRVSPPPKHWKLCWKNLQPLFTTVGSHRRRGGWEREENNRACVPCLSQQRGELGQRGSVSPGPLKEGLLQLSVVVGWGQGRRAPGHLEAKWQERPGSTGSNSMETLTASCAIEGEARGGTTEEVTGKGSVRLLRRVTDIWNMLSRRVTGWGKAPRLFQGGMGEGPPSETQGGF